jgi:hypothetical protein
VQVYSITARSLTKEQLQKLKEAGNTTLNDVIRLKPQPTAQSKTSIQLHSSGEPASGSAPSAHSQTVERAHSPVAPPRKTTATLNLNLQQGSPKSASGEAATPQRQIRPASQRKGSEQYQVELDPNHAPVLIYPDQERSAEADYGYATPAARGPKHANIAHAASTSNSDSKGRVPAPPTDEGTGEAIAMATPKIRSGCISARAAFWERRIMQGEATDTAVEEDFPEMVVPQDDQ